MLVRLALGLIAYMSLADIGWAADAELILTHGKFITVDDQFSIVEAVAIADGRVLATGMASDIEHLPRSSRRRASSTCRGKTVIPRAD